MYAISISDEETKTTINEAYEKHQLLLEPHGSVGWAGLMSYLKEHNNDDTPGQVCVCLETAHPAKFPQEIQDGPLAIRESLWRHTLRLLWKYQARLARRRRSLARPSPRRQGAVK